MSDMKYVRLFAGPDGESHFEDVAVELTEDPPTPFPVSQWRSAERIRFLQYPTDLPRNVHRAPARYLHILLIGSWAMQTSDGETRHFNPGDIILVEDTTGKGHTTWATSKEAALLARIQLPG
jgi:hypothetical protein